MSDFHMSADFLRGQMAQALADNPEQAIWVLAELTDLIHTPEDLQEHVSNMDQPPECVATFYRRLADLIDPGTEEG